MEKIFKVEGTRSGAYFHGFVRASGESEALAKWENAGRFRDKVGQENFKKYRVKRVTLVDREIPSDLIY